MVDRTVPSDRSGSLPDIKDDNASHARAETQGLMMSGTKVALLDSKIWGDVSFDMADASPKTEQKPTTEQKPKTEEKPSSDDNGKAVKGDTKPTEKAAKDDKPEACPGNDDYKAIIDLTARLIYDPSKLGDVEKMMERPCIATTADAIEQADEAIKVADDPYTDVLPPAEATELQTALEGSMSGVGIQIARPEGKDQGPVFAHIVFPDSPSSRAGVKKGDLITAIDGKDVSKIPVEVVADKYLRGEEGTDVKLSISRDGKPMEINVTRGEYSFPSLTDKKIGDFAYIHLEDLTQDDAAEELKGALERHKDAKGFILDLRDNPGGQAPQALLAASLIMEKGEIMKVRSRVDSDPQNPEYATEKYIVTPTGIKVTDENNQQIGGGEEPRMPDLVKKPLVILTNENTGSAAEILAGALKDNKEGVLVGEKTFGKGVGQHVQEGPGGSMISITNFRFFTPSGDWIGDGHKNRTGITPDVKVSNPAGVDYGSAQDEQLNAALKILEEKTAEKKK